MNILEIAFSVDWFLTIPGMLITGGVLLLIIALIMMIASSIKGGKNKEEKTPNNLEQNVNPVPVETPVSNPEPEARPVMDSVAVNAPMGPIEESVVNNAIPSVTNEAVTPIEVVTPTEVVSPMESVVPNMDPVVPIPEVKPVVNAIPTEGIAPIEIAVPENSDFGKTNVNIYGGNPIPTMEAMVNESRPIYGGANPLEATQNLPKIDVHHEPYSGGREEVVEVPSIQPIPDVAPISVMETPVAMPEVKEVEPVTAIPPVVDVTPIDVIEPQAVAPQVVQIPDVEQL